MSDTILEIEDLDTHYGKIHALRSISFTVRKGQIVTLLEPMAQVKVLL